MKVPQLCPTLCDPMDPTIQSTEFSRPEHWIPSPGDLPNPGMKPRSPTLQADSLPAEPPGKPRDTGVGSLSLLPSRPRNWGSALQADSLPTDLWGKPVLLARQSIANQISDFTPGPPNATSRVQGGAMSWARQRDVTSGMAVCRAGDQASTSAPSRSRNGGLSSSTAIGYPQVCYREQDSLFIVLSHSTPVRSNNLDICVFIVYPPTLHIKSNCC